MSEILPCLYDLELSPEAKAAAEASFAEAQAIFNKIVGAVMEHVIPICNEFINEITYILRRIADNVSAVLPSVVEIVFSAYPNKRVVHLAKHGHGRTKKKNIHRILEWYQRELIKCP